MSVKFIYDHQTSINRADYDIDLSLDMIINSGSGEWSDPTEMYIIRSVVSENVNDNGRVVFKKGRKLRLTIEEENEITETFHICR